MQLRFASFAVINLRRDLPPQERARAGRTQKKELPKQGNSLILLVVMGRIELPTYGL